MDQSSDLKRTLQRLLMRLVVLVIAIDVVAIGAYYLLDVEQQGRGVRLGFMIAWVAVTMLVVLPILQQLKAARAAARRRR